MSVNRLKSHEARKKDWLQMLPRRKYSQHLAKKYGQGQKHVTSEFGVSNPESNSFTDYSRTDTSSNFFHHYNRSTEVIENSDTFTAPLLYMADTVRLFLLLFQRACNRAGSGLTLYVYGNASQ